MNTNNPVEKQFENLQIFVVHLKSHENPLTISNESWQSNDLQKGQQLEIVELFVVNIQIQEETERQRNICQKVKGEQTTKIFYCNPTLVQDNLCKMEEEEEEKVSRLINHFLVLKSFLRSDKNPRAFVKLMMVVCQLTRKLEPSKRPVKKRRTMSTMQKSFTHLMM